MAIARIPQLVVRFRQLFVLTAFLASSAAASAQMWGGEYDPSWASHLSVGAMGGFNIKTDFRTGGNFPATPLPAGVYDDGYLHPSQNPQGTSYWGYHDALQYSQSAETMTFHQITSYDTPIGNQSVDANPQVGFQATYGGNLFYVGRVRIGWEFGFGWLPLSITGNESTTNGTAAQSSFVFNVPIVSSTGQYEIMPPAGYANNGSGGQYVLPNAPGSTNHSTGLGASTTGSQTLDVNLFTFRLGPSVYMDLNRHIGMQLGAGPALGYVPGHLKYNEFVSIPGGTTPSHQQGSINVSDVVYGWYVNGMVTYHIVRNGDLFIGAEFMPLGTATLEGSGRQARLNLNGQIHVSAGINWPF